MYNSFLLAISMLGFLHLQSTYAQSGQVRPREPKGSPSDFQAVVSADSEQQSGQAEPEEQEDYGDGAPLTCETSEDCPICSICEEGGHCCIFAGGNEFDDKFCTEGSSCQTGTCSGIGKCQYVQMRDGTECDGNFEKACMNGLCEFMGSSIMDPHMHGLRGQTIDWKGEDGGWYALISDSENVELSVRLTAPLPEEFPDRQLTTGFAIKYEGGHNLIIETKNPYSTVVDGCPEDWSVPCLSENALRITVDGVEQDPVPVDEAHLPGDAVMTAMNLPPECQPYGGALLWAETFAKITTIRYLKEQEQNFIEWASNWSDSTAAPTWCAKFLKEAGKDGTLKHQSKHSVFRIKTPAFTVRLHHGTNHQGGEVLKDGRVLPDLEFWQMDVHLEWYNFDVETVTGMLGETIRPVLDEDGYPIMSGYGALRGTVEDYRISGPLVTDFKLFHG